MKISVIGPGRWGSFIAWYLNSIGHEVLLYGRKDSKDIDSFIKTRTNGVINLPESVGITTNIKEALINDVIIISINSQGLRALAKQIGEYKIDKKTIVLCMKGLEIGTGDRLTEVMADTLTGENQIAVWIGPGHVQEFYSGVPNCMVIDSEDEETKSRLVNEFSSDLIRFYFGTDIIGNEIGAAAKNVIGIAAGMLDGLGVSSLKGALMSRGTREVARLIAAMGGNELSAYGLCHLGDYEATVFSKYSHNRQFGESFVLGEQYTDLAEGYYTVKALMDLAVKYDVALPICKAVYDILYENMDCRETLNSLFKRSLKNEF